jgi:6-pyruvoyltetrahydropterin/6-carboxytetrahydropterin synthase
VFTISKEFHFSASHQLNNVPEGHPCSRMHGHNYKVELVLEAEELVAGGFVLDYNHMKPFGEWIDKVLDHRHLNDTTSLLADNPTAELIALLLYEVAKDVLPAQPNYRVAVVRVSETPKTWAEYRPERYSHEAHEGTVQSREVRG